MCCVGEILDLGWSLSDDYLASCSVDNSIIVWNGLRLPEKLHIIKQHSGMVKGVCWDPIGKYLASQSDDRSLRVWRTEDWSLETQLTEPFNNCSGTTHLLRLSWSPDGRNIVTAHALNNAFPVSHIVDRNNWQSDKSLVGHQKAIEVASFNPNLFSYDLKSSRNHTVVALGSKDSSISIWSTAKTQPILLLEQIFTSSILDLSWSSDGYQLLACSWDSTIAHLTFSKTELGFVLESSFLLKLHMDTYGCTSLPSAPNSISTNILIETPMLLSLKDATPTLQLTNGDSQTNSARAPILSQKHTTEQIEIRTKEGKRRITPKFISSPLQADPTPQPKLSTCTIPKHIPPESNTLSNVTTGNTLNADISSVTTNTITSTCVPSTTSIAIIPPVVSTSSGIKNVAIQSTIPTSSIVHSSAPLPSLEKAYETKENSIELDSIPPSFSHDTSQYSLRIDNTISYGALIRVTTIEPSSAPPKHWEAILSSQVVSYCCTDCHVVASCLDCSMHIFSRSGRRIIAPLQLPSAVTKIVISDNSLLAITVHFNLYMWDLSVMRCELASQPVSPLLANKKLRIIDLSVRECGPILTLSNDTSFLFNKQLSCWQSIQLTYSLDSQAGNLTHPFSSLLTSGVSSMARNKLFIESQLTSALAMNSRNDFQRWLIRYVQFLTEHELESQLRELLTELIQPLLDISETTQHTPLQKLVSENHTLINTILRIVAKNVRLQKIYTEFSESMDLSYKDRL